MQVINGEYPFIPSPASRKVVQIGWYGGEMLVYDTLRRSIECYANDCVHAFTVAKDEDAFLELFLVLHPPHTPNESLVYDNKVYRKLRLDALERVDGCKGVRLFFSRSWGEEYLSQGQMNCTSMRLCRCSINEALR